MNIAIFTNNYLPNPYGVSTSIESFRKEFEKHGHSVYIFAPKFKGYVDENQNASLGDRRVFRYPSIDFTIKGINFPLAIPVSFRINKILKDLDIDIIHSQHPNLLGREAKNWAKKKKLPLVFTWHTLYDQYAHFTPIIPEKIAAWWAIGNAIRFANSANQIITPTPSVAKIIRTWGVKNENLISIASGVDEKEFANADGGPIRKKFGVTNDEILLVLISRITAEKNMAFLMRAVSVVLERNKKVKFLVCGGGDQIQVMQKLAKSKGVAQQVIFAGLVTNVERKNYFAAGDIFVYASKSETQGTVITEAMYSGLPIVAVNAPGIVDLVVENETGFLTKENEGAFSSAVEKLVGNADLRRKFSENAKKIAQEKYTASVCAEKMLEVYEKTIKRKS